MTTYTSRNGSTAADSSSTSDDTSAMPAPTVKADVKGRVTDRIGAAAGQLTGVTAHAAGRLREQVAVGVGSLRTADLATVARRPVPVAALAAAVTTAVVALILIRGHRR
jgi:hypothetical protein